MRALAPLAAVLIALTGLAACGGGGESTSTANGGEVRTVLVDHKDDEFASAFLQYYPEHVTVRQGDTVRFKQSWTGEPHSVTAGSVVEDVFKNEKLVEKYNSAADARAAGVPEDVIQTVLHAFSRIPPMVAGESAASVFQPGAQPCFVDANTDFPAFSDPEADTPLPGAKCPTKGQAQPAFNGTDQLYSSGFIPYDGAKANTFEIPIAADAKPGTYHYFCNYHWTGMSGTFTVVPKSQKIPSQSAVIAQAGKEITKDAKAARQKADAAQSGKVDKAKVPLAGVDTGSDPESSPPVIINEFVPTAAKAKVGQKVTWTFQGSYHTVSFNVPKYFPLFSIKKDGTVTRNAKSVDPVAWKLPERPKGDDPQNEPALVADVGKWDGSGGFHSSGALAPGDKFTVTFTRPGTYRYACVLHPQMIGTLNVST